MVTDDQLTANIDSHFIKPVTNMGHGASYPNTPTVSLSIKQSSHTCKWMWIPCIHYLYAVSAVKWIWTVPIIQCSIYCHSHKNKTKNGKGKTHLKKGNAIEQQWSSSMFDIQILFRAFQNRKKSCNLQRRYLDLLASNVTRFAKLVLL
jgi:hypothetical protein